jgi:hypothetical protein
MYILSIPSCFMNANDFSDIVVKVYSTCKLRPNSGSCTPVLGRTGTANLDQLRVRVSISLFMSTINFTLLYVRRDSHYSSLSSRLLEEIRRKDIQNDSQTSCAQTTPCPAWLIILSDLSACFRSPNVHAPLRLTTPTVIQLSSLLSNDLASQTITLISPIPHLLHQTSR